MSERYRFDLSRSRFTVQAFATGLLSALGHSPTFAAHDFHGEIRFEGGRIDGLALDLHIKAESLGLLDKVSAADHREIEERMRRDVLGTEAYPEIIYEAAGVPAEAVTRSEHRLRIDGRLTLCGVTRVQRVDADLQIFTDGVRLTGQCPLRMSDYRIRPVTALAGAIKLKDELRLTFDLCAAPEGS